MDLNLKEKANKIKIYIPALFLALKKPKTPLIAKFFGLLTIGYALSPIDLIPDFIPVIGYLDDLILLPILIALTLRFIPPDIMEACLNESKDLWKDGKPKVWYFALPILLFWLLVILWIALKIRNLLL